MSAPAAKRRKVRKGTHSCWECRRRKIKCQFNDDNDTTCIGCLARETACISQEFTHESAPTPDRRLTQRLGRLEQLMEKLIERSDLDDPSPPKPVSPPDTASPPTNSRFARQGTDVFDISAAGHAQQVAIVRSGEPQLGRLTAPDTHPRCIKTPARVAKFEGVAKQLHALFPPRKTLRVLSESPGAKYVLGAFYSHQEQVNGKPEPTSALTQVPDVKSHPALLAKRLLQLAVCMQQMPQESDNGRLGLEKSPIETMEEWVSTANGLVSSDDDFVGCLEGLECLIIQSFYQSDAGQLRKAWITSRRALNMGQLMGIDRKGSRPIRSCDHSMDPRRLPTPAVLWFRINCIDRYLSLLLGLSIGCRDNSFAADDSTWGDAPHDRLGKSYAVISGMIADRNDMTGSEAYALTQNIDLELEKQAKEMDGLWWQLPAVSVCSNASDHYIEDSSALKLQIRHYSLVILLHLPYLLKDRDQRRYEYNRNACMEASRAVLSRFLDYRKMVTNAVAGRHVDYSALVAAMTLLLGHIGKRSLDDEEQRLKDRELAEKVQAMMHEMGVLNHDALFTESADTIRELLPIVNVVCPSGASCDKSLQLNIPLLGTVTISASSAPASAPSSNPMPSLTDTPAEFNYTNGNTNTDTSFSLSFDLPSAQPQIPTADPMSSAFPESTAQDLYPTEWPGFTADFEDWALQGVDTSYWSMLNSSMN